MSKCDGGPLRSGDQRKSTGCVHPRKRVPDNHRELGYRNPDPLLQSGLRFLSAYGSENARELIQLRAQYQGGTLRQAETDANKVGEFLNESQRNAAAIALV